MGTTEETLTRLKRETFSGDLAKASPETLNGYAAALCHAQAFTMFSTHEFSQICETVRIHLLRAHIEAIERRASRYQWLIVALAVASLISSVVQIYVQVSQQAQLIASAQPAQATPKVTANPAQSLPNSDAIE